MTMIDSTTGGEIVTEETAPVTETETQETETEEIEGGEGEITQEQNPEFDPLKYIDSLEIDDKQKQIMRDGYLRQEDYTRKTQEIATVRKAADAYDKLRPYLPKIFNDQAIFDAVFQGKPLQVATPAKPEEEVIPDDPKEYAEYMLKKADERIQKALEDRDRQWQERVQQQEQAQVMQAQLMEAEKLDPRLNNDQDFANIIAGLVAQNPDLSKIGVVEATKQALAYHERYIQTVAQKLKTELIEKAKNKPTSIAKRTSNGSVSAANKPVADMRQAWAEAEAEMSNTK